MSELIPTFVKAIFLLLLAVLGNFVAETIGCGTQRIMSKNMVYKHAVIFCMIYFTLGFVDSAAPHPGYQLLSAAAVYAMFVCFTKMENYMTGMALFILMANYMFGNFARYYRDKGVMGLGAGAIEKILFVLLNATVLFGFGQYALRQRREHAKHWSTAKFWFGVPTCGAPDR